MEEKSCISCSYFHRSAELGKGFCKRYPPVPHPIPSPGPGGQMGIQVVGLRPQVDINVVCGEWKTSIEVSLI